MAFAASCAALPHKLQHLCALIGIRGVDNVYSLPFLQENSVSKGMPTHPILRKTLKCVSL